MFELSKTVFALLNVAAITNVATGGVWPLLGPQESRNFVTYSLEWDRSITKNSRTSVQLNINCYSPKYNDALQLHDAVEKVLDNQSIYLERMTPGYTDEDFDAVVRSTYTLKTTLTIN